MNQPAPTSDSITEQAAPTSQVAAAVLAIHTWQEYVYSPPGKFRDAVGKLCDVCDDHWPCATVRAVSEAAAPAHQAPATEKADALREVAEAYRAADASGYLFLGDGSERVPWAAVARDLDERAARIAPEAPAAEDGSSTREDYTVALIAEGPTQSLTWPTAAGARAWLDSAQRGADGPKFPHAVVLHRVTTLREVAP